MTTKMSQRKATVKPLTSQHLAAVNLNEMSVSRKYSFAEARQEKEPATASVTLS
jgi:hypothetical protein